MTRQRERSETRSYRKLRSFGSRARFSLLDQPPGVRARWMMNPGEMSPRCRLQHGHGGRRHYPGALRRAWRGGSCPPSCHSLRGTRALAEPEFQSEFQPEFHPGQHRWRTDSRRGRHAVAAYVLAVSGCSGRRWVVRISLSGIISDTRKGEDQDPFFFFSHMTSEKIMVSS